MASSYSRYTLKVQCSLVVTFTTYLLKLYFFGSQSFSFTAHVAATAPEIADSMTVQALSEVLII